ncbi:MAG: flavin reductase family protein [Pyrinomonadaceae bacterium]
MPVDPDEFRLVLSRFASGVTVVTACDATGHPHGITVSAFCSVSLSPPLILVSIEKAAGSHDAIKGSGSFVVNILRESQRELSEHFALPINGKFASVEHRTGTGGIPVLSGTLGALECRLRNDYDGGDHTIFVGEVEDSSVEDGEPLLYYRGGYHEIAV